MTWKTRTHNMGMHNCMGTLQNIKEISLNIWESCENRPTRLETEPFDDQLNQVDIKEFIVYNFLNHHGTALRELLLSIFTLWKDLNLEDWTEIFTRLKGNNLAEYYMSIIANQYLGIDPKYESTSKVEIVHFTPGDQKYQSGKPSLFVNNMQGELRQMQEEELHESFGITIQDFVEISKRLTNERRNVSNLKNIWSRLWNK